MVRCLDCFPSFHSICFSHTLSRCTYCFCMICITGDDEEQKPIQHNNEEEGKEEEMDVEDEEGEEGEEGEVEGEVEGEEGEVEGEVEGEEVEEGGEKEDGAMNVARDVPVPSPPSSAQGALPIIMF